MGKATLLREYTPEFPISMIGRMAAVCQGGDVDNTDAVCRRGIECLESGHGRTFEFPDVYMILDGYSARTIREWYTHIGGAPTRLQASTRYINYQRGFDYVTPPSIQSNPDAKAVYDSLILHSQTALQELERLGIPREDSAMMLPLGMETRIVDKRNLRNLIDMAGQRMCTRAYHEYRTLFKDYCDELRKYSNEWAYLVDHYFVPKCVKIGYCPEKKTCGMMPRKGETG